MTVLAQRRCRLVLGERLVEGLRVQFEVRKTSEKEPNTASVTVWNLSASTRDALQRKGYPMVLEAGYQDTLQQIFSGDVRHTESAANGPDWITKAEAGDGEKAYAYARVAEAFPANTSRASVLRAIARALGVDAQSAIAALGDVGQQPLPGGYVAFSQASLELNRLLAGTGKTWSIQDGKLQIRSIGQVATEGRAVRLSSDSGLIGSPGWGTAPKEGKPRHLEVRALLQPAVRVGGVVEVDAVSVSGQYRVVSLRHTGDTAGGDWFTDLELLPR